MYGLQGKTAIVTGSGRKNGIGEAIIMRLAEEGCNVVVSDIGTPKGENFPGTAVGTTQEMEHIVEEAKAKGAKALAVPCDVRVAAEVEHLVQQAVKSFGGLDVYVNNAGVGYIMQLVTEMDEEKWDAVLDVNVKGYFLGTKYAGRQMIAQTQAGKRGGRIINIGSQASKSGFPYAAAYTSSKHAVVGLTRATAIELAQYGITVNTICPNHITTGLGDWQNKFFAEKTGKTYEQYMTDMKSRIPLGRAGLTTDIAKACAFLASDQAEYITGEAMNVSGGEEMH
jgi:meso-butanediol dehydrogenase/(S,S)-butanediol dehydrogenase/diacetyl reductase